MGNTNTGWTICLIAGIIMLFEACNSKTAIPQQKEELLIEVTNTSDLERTNVMVSVNISEAQLQSGDFEVGKLIVLKEQVEVPSQISDGKLMFIADTLKVGMKSEFAFQSSESKMDYAKRTQAELSIKTGGHFENRKYIGGDFVNIDSLRVPPEHTDHSFFIRYEGPGWESDLVGYRFYLDWRNATDAFGKKTTDMVLQQVGLDGFDSYHEMQPWGMDVLKVGKSLGIGSLALYHDSKAERVEKTDSVSCMVLENGPVYSAIKTQYYGWKVGEYQMDLTSVLSIHAGTRLSHHEITVSGLPENLCTGIVKDSNARLFTDQGSSDSWGYIATYGLQSLNSDHLGLAVFFSNLDFKGFTEDEFSHIVKLDPSEGNLDYYFLVAWELEPSGFRTENDFMNYVKQTAVELATPPQVTVAK